MASTDNTLTLKIGDTVSETIVIQDAAGAPVDITDGTVKFAIKRKLTDSDGDAIYYNPDLTLSDPENGEATLSIDDAVSGQWTPVNAYWQVRYISSSGDVNSTDVGVCKLVRNLFDNEA